MVGVLQIVGSIPARLQFAGLYSGAIVPASERTQKELVNVVWAQLGLKAMA